MRGRGGGSELCSEGVELYAWVDKHPCIYMYASSVDGWACDGGAIVKLVVYVKMEKK